MPKKTKNTKIKQRGKGVKENYEFVAKKYGPTFEDWLKTPLAQMALKEKNETGYSKYYDDYKAVYDYRYPSDVTEATRPYYRNPKTDTKVGKWLRDNSTQLLKAGFKTVANIIGVPHETGVSEWYGLKFEDWLARPTGQAALKDKMETGYSQLYDDMKALYEMRITGDRVEATGPYYRNPKTDTKE